jgi:hypothetical protein
MRIEAATVLSRSYQKEHLRIGTDGKKEWQMGIHNEGLLALAAHTSVVSTGLQALWEAKHQKYLAHLGTGNRTIILQLVYCAWLNNLSVRESGRADHQIKTGGVRPTYNSGADHPVLRGLDCYACALHKINQITPHPEKFPLLEFRIKEVHKFRIRWL